MAARVLFIGLDATQATLLEGGFGGGPLPGLRSLGEAGMRARLGNRIDTLPDAVWPELATGRSAGKAPLYCPTRQLHTGEAVPRPVSESDANPEAHFPTVAARAGKRVATIDLPYAVPVRGLGGVQLVEWGTHEPWLGVRSEPPAFLDGVRARYGDNAVRRCDLVQGGTPSDYERLLDELLADIERKRHLLGDLLQESDWDLVAACFTEAHCAGHQFWSLYDETHPLHGEHAPPRLRDALVLVYRALDDAVADLVSRAGPDATVVVVASHGMGPHVGGDLLLPVVLERLGLGPRRARLAQVRGSLGGRARRVWRRSLPEPLRARVNKRLNVATERLDRRGTRAVALENNQCGAIRLNVIGREPTGTVAPGAEADRLIEELRRELLALVDPECGEPIVRAIATADEAFGADHHPDVPDLMVAFRAGLAPIEACASPSIGEVRAPLYRPFAGGGTADWPTRPRTGDHTGESRLWMRGPGIAPDPRLRTGDVLDVAPTLLSLLDVPLPSWLDGSVL